jgi:DNA-binding MarR family transcriptional regulator
MGKSELIMEAIRLDREAHRALRRPLFEGWTGLNLTVPQLRSLFFISSKGASSPGRLAAAMGVTPPNITGIVDRLVDQGLVVRGESDRDRRVLQLQATEKGETILSDLREWRTNSMHDVLSRLEESELQSLVNGLCAMVRACGERKQEGLEEGQGRSSTPEVESVGAC